MVLFSVAFEGDKEIHLYTRLANAAEKYGFHTIQIYEHIPFRPAWPIVFHIAKDTNKIKIGPVTVPVFQSDPLTLARNIAVLNELTDGRAIIGISRGAYHKFMPTSFNRSRQTVLEAVSAINAVLRGRSYQGSIFRVRGAESFKWIQRQRPEIYVGTSGPKLCYEASKLKAVDGIVVDNLWNPKYAEFLKKRIKKATEKTGRKEKVQLIARPFTMIARNREEAVEKIMPILSKYVPHLVGDSPMLAATGVTYEEASHRPGRRVLEKLASHFAALGNPDELVEQTSKMVKAGVDHVCFGHPVGRSIEEIRTLGEDVLTHFVS